MKLKRNLLCVKKEEDLDLGHLLLYKPYKNILIKFINLATEKTAIDFDPIARAFDGLESVSEDVKFYYESLLGISSYYQHSQGGKGKYIEKKISSVMETCSMNIKISELPMWLEYPNLHRKKGIFTQTGLSSKDKSILRNIEWDWLGKEDETTDVGNYLPGEGNLILVELKNRVDTGGTAGRREIWTKKFKTILEILINKQPIYSYRHKKYSLLEALKHFNIKKFEMYIGILFNVDGTPATKSGDKQRGFFSSNLEGYNDLKNFLHSYPILKIEKENPNDLLITIEFPNINLKINVGALYGDQIPKALFHQNYSISDLLLLRYDDMWLSQLIAIDERTLLLKYSKNYMLNLTKLLRQNRDLRLKYDRLIKTECKEKNLNDFISYLLENYPDHFSIELLPNGKNQKRYLADIIQVLCASEA